MTDKMDSPTLSNLVASIKNYFLLLFPSSSNVSVFVGFNIGQSVNKARSLRPNNTKNLSFCSFWISLDADEYA